MPRSLLFVLSTSLFRGARMIRSPKYSGGEGGVNPMPGWISEINVSTPGREIVSLSLHPRPWLTSSSQEENTRAPGSSTKCMFCFNLRTSLPAYSCDWRSEAKTMSALEQLRTTGRICWRSPPKTTVMAPNGRCGILRRSRQVRSTVSWRHTGTTWY